MYNISTAVMQLFTQRQQKCRNTICKTGHSGKCDDRYTWYVAIHRRPWRLAQKITQWNLHVTLDTRWCGDVIGRASDLRFTGYRFEHYQLVASVLLYDLVLAKRQWCPLARKVTEGQVESNGSLHLVYDYICAGVNTHLLWLLLPQRPSL